MTTLQERLDAQNNGHAWLDCNERGRPHRWVLDNTIRDAHWYRCTRCPIATVSERLDSDGRRVPPSPFLR